jgi:YbbR domain-containing protein
MKFLATIRNWLTNDVGWKVFSLILAAAIWFTVNKVLQEPTAVKHGSTGATLTYGNLPILIVASAADVHLYRVIPETVTVTVSGSPEAIAALQVSQIRATVDLTGIDAGNELKRNVDVSVPSGITVTRVEPVKVGVIVPPEK